MTDTINANDDESSDELTENGIFAPDWDMTRADLVDIHGEPKHETEDTIVFADTKGYAFDEWSDVFGDGFSHRMHELANEFEPNDGIDHWGAAWPVVFDARTFVDDSDESTNDDGGEFDDLVIVIDPDEIVQALKNDGERPDRNGREVITVRPPFDGERRAHHRFSETGTFWPPEMDPEPLDLNPDQFHDAEWDYPERAEIHAAAKELAGVEDIRDVPDEIRNETRAIHVEVWGSEVRNSLVDEIDITGDCEQGVMVPVRFEESEQ